MADDMMKGMVSVMGMVMMAGVMMAILPQPAEAVPEPEPPTPTGYGCPYCTPTLFFDSIAELVAHISEVHPGEPNFEEVDIGWG